MNPKRYLFGAGEMAGLIYDNLRQVIGNFSGFIVDDPKGVKSFRGMPLYDYRTFLKSGIDEAEVHVAIGYSKLNYTRTAVFERLKSDGVRFYNIVGSGIFGPGSFSIGENVCIFDNQTIQSGVKIGSNVLIWSGNHIGHDVVIHSGAYLSSHVTVSGHVEIGSRCFIGVNSAIKDGVSIGPDSIIGMGSTVTKNLPAGSVTSPESTIVYLSDSRVAKLIRRLF